MIDGFEISVTVSFGTAIFPEDGQQVDDLMKKADASMYGRKPAHREVSIYPRAPGYPVDRGSVQAHGVEMHR